MILSGRDGLPETGWCVGKRMKRIFGVLGCLVLVGILLVSVMAVYVYVSSRSVSIEAIYKGSTKCGHVVYLTGTVTEHDKWGESYKINDGEGAGRTSLTEIRIATTAGKAIPNIGNKVKVSGFLSCSRLSPYSDPFPDASKKRLGAMSNECTPRSPSVA